MKVKSPEGKEFEVTEKAYRLVYERLGFKPVAEKKTAAKKDEKTEEK